MNLFKGLIELDKDILALLCFVLLKTHHPWCAKKLIEELKTISHETNNNFNNDHKKRINCSAPLE